MDLNNTVSSFGDYYLRNGGASGMVVKLLISLIILIAGIIIGRLVTKILSRVTKDKYFEKNIRPSFIGLAITIIRWSIYIAFFNLALSSLEIPALTRVITKTLMTIPAIVSSIILLSFGFAIAIYLREIVEDSEVAGWKFLSLYIFYFTNLIFALYAFKIALMLFDPLVSQIISILVLGIVGISIAYVYVKKELRDVSYKK